jgi:tetratricopeptide (TPR) repeat protein
LIDRYEAELAPSIPSYRVKLDRSEPSLRQALENLVDRHPELQAPKANAVITAIGAADLLSFKLGESEANSALDRRLSNWNEAESLDLECLKIQTELGDRAGMATSWGLLGDIARNRGDYDKAESLFNQSLKVRTELGDRAGMATSWGLLGDIARSRGDYDKAEALYNQCLDIAEDLQMAWHIAETNWDLAQLYRAKSDESQAQQHYSIAHDLFIKLGAKGDLERIEKEWI